MLAEDKTFYLFACKRNECLVKKKAFILKALLAAPWFFLNISRTLEKGEMYGSREGWLVHESLSQMWSALQTKKTNRVQTIKHGSAFFCIFKNFQVHIQKMSCHTTCSPVDINIYALM